jgi:TRAP-type C4-dicarboxylate transport system substrate-binding protein
MTRHTYAPALFVMSLKLYGSLAPEVQAVLTDAASQAAKHERNWNAEQEKGQLKVLADEGMKVVSPDLASFKEAVKPVYKKYSDRFGDVLADIQKMKK